MYPQPQNLHLDAEAISGILGSVSIACWVVVFSPQIIENFRRSSADGLSLSFIIIWLTGDVFNILGGVLQGILPTMIVLALYYTLADIVLLAQCLYYRRNRAGIDVKATTKKTTETNTSSYPSDTTATEESPLLQGNQDYRSPGEENDARPSLRQLSTTSVDGTHLSPATPLVSNHDSDPPAARNLKPTSALQAVLFNTTALLLVCAAGAFGWWLSTWHYSHRGPNNLSITGSSSLRPNFRALKLHVPAATAIIDKGSEKISREVEDHLELDPLGQVFGYLCAVLYLASRLPQILLNARRRSTEGVSILFFLFACVGNLTYVLSILVYEPACARAEAHAGAEPGAMPGTVALQAAGGCADGAFAREYGRYILLNASWLIGSAGTLALDGVIFLQFWMYKNNQPALQADHQDEER